VAVSAAASLPAPPPLSAPLGVAGTGPMRQLRQTAPAGATWWSGPGPGSAQTPIGPLPSGSVPSGSAPPPFPAAQPPAPATRPVPPQVVGALALGLGIVLLIVGDVGHVTILALIGLAAGAWGMWWLITKRGKNTKPPGQP
jgi:hypothetical protein